VLRILVASAIVAGVTYGVWYALDQVAGRSFIGQVVSVGTALAAALGTYLLACRALRVRELGALLALRSRFSGAQP
jgi:predicted membrane protein